MDCYCDIGSKEDKSNNVALENKNEKGLLQTLYELEQAHHNSRNPQ